MTSRKTKSSNAADQNITSTSPSAGRLRRTFQRDELGEMSDTGLIPAPRAVDKPVESERYLGRTVHNA